jgi:hypothetical protein
MSFITTNPNPFIVNVPELQGVITSATGTTTLAETVNTLAQYIDSTTNSALFNTIGSFNSGNVIVTNDIYLSNAALYVNDSPVIVNNNTLNGSLYTAMTINNTEIARFTSNGLGIFTTSPSAALHINGSLVLQSDTNAMNFMNAAGTITSGLAYANTTSSITLKNTGGDVVVDANGGGVSLKTDTILELDGISILTGSAGASSGDFLRLKINGTFYKIALLADV